MRGIAEIMATGNFEKKPAEYNPIKRFYRNPTYLKAIRAKCAECMGCEADEQGHGRKDHLERGFRDEIANCTAPACPLFMYRPYQEIAA